MKAKHEHVDISPPAPVVPERPICAVCGQYEGPFIEVTTKAVAHEACATASPDVIEKVKARA